MFQGQGAAELLDQCWPVTDSEASSHDTLTVAQVFTSSPTPRHRWTALAAVAAQERGLHSKQEHKFDDAPTDVEYDAVIIGSGMGGLTTATQMASKGARVVVLEKSALAV